jgi:X breakpoint 2-interacting protein
MYFCNRVDQLDMEEQLSSSPRYHVLWRFMSLQVDAYEAQKQELITENTDLRNMLRSMQGDMRDCLNVPGSLPRSSGGTRANGMFDLEPPQTALGECTDVIDLPVQMARDQIEQSLRAKMASIKECMMQLQGSQKGLQSTES